ncbi:hypothetical protein [Mucilaginibacter sp.]|jgi:hypothetical protein|uniref:glycosyl-4,4'-diaponeurosporenoate acyltransferase CrtO family protein n=1 Tax=Mucilaginibacter sp. TaxID=1882438 RepID=UPI00356A1566
MNQAVNFFWTILCFAPIIGFWFTANSILLCFILIGISVASQVFPARHLQLSNDPKFYEGLGVKQIRKFVQNGELINKFIRKNNPQYKVIKGKTNAVKYMQTIVMYERFHLICFIFFLLTAVYAVIAAQYAFALIIIIANIIYNICPILLQQYNRARLAKLRR